MNERDYAYREEFGRRRFLPWVFLSRAARIRREQLRLMERGFHFRRPFWRFLSLTADIRIVVYVAMYTMFWLFTVVTRLHPVEWMTGFFLALLVVELAYYVTVKLHGHIMEHWGASLKVNVGSMYPLPAGDLVPGTRIRHLALPKSETGDDMEFIAVELIRTGYVAKTWGKLADKSAPFIVARANFTNDQGRPCAGLMFGAEEYLIPARWEPHLAGDMDNWRSAVYLQALRAEFPGLVTDFSVVIVAMDPIDIRLHASSAMTATLRQEFYELAQRERQVTRRHLDELGRDSRIRARRED